MKILFRMKSKQVISRACEHAGLIFNRVQTSLTLKRANKNFIPRELKTTVTFLKIALIATHFLEK